MESAQSVYCYLYVFDFKDIHTELYDQLEKPFPGDNYFYLFQNFLVAYSSLSWWGPVKDFPTSLLMSS